MDWWSDLVFDNAEMTAGYNASLLMEYNYGRLEKIVFNGAIIEGRDIYTGRKNGLIQLICYNWG
jgi:hypothetical protein